MSAPSPSPRVGGIDMDTHSDMGSSPHAALSELSDVDMGTGASVDAGASVVGGAPASARGRGRGRGRGGNRGRPPPVVAHDNCAEGVKRQRLGAAGAPDAPDASDASEASHAWKLPRHPSWLLPVARPFCDAGLTFERVVAVRCLSGKEYRLDTTAHNALSIARMRDEGWRPSPNWPAALRDDDAALRAIDTAIEAHESKPWQRRDLQHNPQLAANAGWEPIEDDGLLSFWLKRATKALLDEPELKSAEFEDTRKIVECLQTRCTATVEDGVKSLDLVRVLSASCRLPQLEKRSEAHAVLGVTSESGVEIGADRQICMQDGSTYGAVPVATRDEHVVRKTRLVVRIELHAFIDQSANATQDRERQLERPMHPLAGRVVTLTIAADELAVKCELHPDRPTGEGPAPQPRPPVADEWAVPLSEGFAARALDVSRWSMREVEAQRLEVGFVDVPPLEIALLAACLTDTASAWSELFLLRSGGRMRARPLSTPSSGDRYEFYACDPTSCLWTVDRCDHRFRGHMQDLAASAALLAGDPKRLCSTVRAADDRGLLKRSDVERLRARVLDATKDAGPVLVTDGPLVGLDEQDMHQCFSALVMDIHPQTGRSKPLFTREQTGRDLFAAEGPLQLQATNIFAFSNGECYDPAARAVRRIRPEDGASISTGYALPGHDDAKQKRLRELLLEIHEPAVLEWRTQLKTRLLDGTQAKPLVLFDVGVAGAGKGVESELTMAALGGETAYGKTVGAAFLCKSKYANPEGHSTQLASLADARWVYAHEVGELDSDRLKNLTGGNAINARRANEREAICFRPKFALNFTLNEDSDIKKRLTFKRDDGVQRRFSACRFKGKFTNVNDAAAAKEIEDRWASGVRDEEDDDDDGTLRATMHPAKYEELMGLAPHFMRLLVDTHIACHTGKAPWLDPPEAVRVETERLLGIGGVEVEPPGIADVFQNVAERCSCCAIRPSCLDQFSTSSEDIGETLPGGKFRACTHFLQADALIAGFKKIRIDPSGASDLTFYGLMQRQALTAGARKKSVVFKYILQLLSAEKLFEVGEGPNKVALTLVAQSGRTSAMRGIGVYGFRPKAGAEPEAQPEAGVAAAANEADTGAGVGA